MSLAPLAGIPFALDSLSVSAPSAAGLDQGIESPSDLCALFLPPSQLADLWVAFRNSEAGGMWVQLCLARVEAQVSLF